MGRLVGLFAPALGLLVLAVPPGQAADSDYDLVIRNGHVIDGTGSPWYAADVAVRDGRIAAIGNLGPARALRSIDAHGQVVAPGFIDMLGQSEPARRAQAGIDYVRSAA